MPRGKLREEGGTSDSPETFLYYYCPECWRSREGGLRFESAATGGLEPPSLDEEWMERGSKWLTQIG